MDVSVHVTHDGTMRLTLDDLKWKEMKTFRVSFILVKVMKGNFSNFYKAPLSSAGAFWLFW